LCDGRKALPDEDPVIGKFAPQNLSQSHCLKFLHFVIIMGEEKKRKHANDQNDDDNKKKRKSVSSISTLF